MYLHKGLVILKIIELELSYGNCQEAQTENFEQIQIMYNKNTYIYSFIYLKTCDDSLHRHNKKVVLKMFLV